MFGSHFGELISDPKSILIEARESSLCVKHNKHEFLQLNFTTLPQQKPLFNKCVQT